MRLHTTSLKNGITRTPEFERKGLAAFAVNIGTKVSGTRDAGSGQKAK
jgi:hypothetical protein